MRHAGFEPRRVPKDVMRSAQINIFNMLLMRFMKRVSQYVMSARRLPQCAVNVLLCYSAYRYPIIPGSMTRSLPMS